MSGGGPSPPSWPEPGATANKTWLMFENMIIAAGEAEIPKKGVVVTSVEQALLRGAVYVGDAKSGTLLPVGSERVIDLSAAGAWVLHNGVGYLLPQTVGAVAHISSANKTGDWSSLGVETGNVTLGVFDLYIVQAKDYLYMIMPINATVSGMPAALAGSGGYTLAGGDSSRFRAALDPTGDVLLGAVWAKDGTPVNVGCWSVRPSRACAFLLYKWVNGTLSVSASVPGADGGANLSFTSFVH